MPRDFNIPQFYRSNILTAIKDRRRQSDPLKRDFSPTIYEGAQFTFKIARHFGFCFGVESAIEISYKAISENPGKRVFLISEMIHNPKVNNDLRERGVNFIMKTDGSLLFNINELTHADVVIVPAFGAALPVLQQLEQRGVNIVNYDATCPFVEKVWNKAAELGAKEYTIIIHGKYNHEETKATFSRALQKAPVVVVRDLAEAKILAEIIAGNAPIAMFKTHFAGKYSENFDPEKHLFKFGVINQTTMLASETKEISLLIRQAVIQRFGEENIKNHFADTRDTLCYATLDNQRAVLGLIESGGDLAIIVGGYNSSNTSHLLELLETQFPSYFIQDREDILDRDNIQHFNLHLNKVVKTTNWLNANKKLTILITAGASCPDATVADVIEKIDGL